MLVLATVLGQEPVPGGQVQRWPPWGSCRLAPRVALGTSPSPDLGSVVVPPTCELPDMWYLRRFRQDGLVPADTTRRQLCSHPSHLLTFQSEFLYWEHLTPRLTGEWLLSPLACPFRAGEALMPIRETQSLTSSTCPQGASSWSERERGNH